MVLMRFEHQDVWRVTFRDNANPQTVLFLCILGSAKLAGGSGAYRNDRTRINGRFLE